MTNVRIGLRFSLLLRLRLIFLLKFKLLLRHWNVTCAGFPARACACARLGADVHAGVFMEGQRLSGF